MKVAARCAGGPDLWPHTRAAVLVFDRLRDTQEAEAVKALAPLTRVILSQTAAACSRGTERECASLLSELRSLAAAYAPAPSAAPPPEYARVCLALGALMRASAGAEPDWARVRRARALSRARPPPQPILAPADDAEYYELRTASLPPGSRLNTI